MQLKILHTLNKPKHANWKRNVEIFEQRQCGMSIEELADWHDVSEQRIKQILNAVENKIRDGKIEKAAESPQPPT
jgi:Mor family transcriptional regulator